ncbi:MAG TPA: ROK family protein [Ktedonobacterales bacterium]
MDNEPGACGYGGASAIGVELADLATRLAVVAVGADGQRLGRVQRVRLERPPTPDETVERLGALITEQRAGATLTEVGVAVWAHVQPERGVIDEPRFGVAWNTYPFVERLSAAVGAPVRLIAGVNAAARAEARVDVAIEKSPLLYIHQGRTVTSALVIDGEPLLGARYDAGRLGHWQTGLDGPRCQCGVRGHLDPLASAQSLARLAIGVAADDDEALAAIHRITGMRAEALTAPQVIALARDGVRAIRELVDVAVDALAGALADLVVTLDPAIIVIGGPLALADAVYPGWLRERLGERLASVMSAAPPVVAATLEPNAAALGAAQLSDAARHAAG